jgi:hypothetical protein
VLYDLSNQYGIDDAYALAFFRQENSYGTTGVARFTKSLGNIECTPGYRCLSGFRSYARYEQGYKDWYQLLRNLYVNTWHLTTVQQIIPVYAPAKGGNNPPAYIAHVLAIVSIWQQGQVQV